MADRKRHGLSKLVWAMRLEDLKGERPWRHTTSRLNPSGSVYIRSGQVWVERETQRLWQVVSVKHFGKHGLKRRIGLVPYKGNPDYVVVLEEPQLHALLIVWDEAIKEGGSIDEAK